MELEQLQVPGVHCNKFWSVKVLFQSGLLSSIAGAMHCA